MGGKRSQDKGKRAEREVVQLLQPIVDNVYAVLRDTYPHFAEWLATPRLQRNTVQAHAGGCDLCGLDWLALEVKHREALNIIEAWKQTVSQAKHGQEPVLFYRRNGAAFKVRMWLQRYHEDGIWWYVPAEVNAIEFLVFFEHKVRLEAIKKLRHLSAH